MTAGLLRLAITLACSFLAALPCFAAEKFKRLSPNEFTRQFVGHTVGDEAHWSYRFGADAAVDAMDLGKTRRGLWRFSRGKLCMDFAERGKSVSDCYEILMSGKNVRFLRDGVLIVESRLLDE